MLYDVIISKITQTIRAFDVTNERFLGVDLLAITPEFVGERNHLWRPDAPILLVKGEVKLWRAS